MKVETVVVGYLEENCYVLKKGNDALVIDPGSDIDKIRAAIGDSKVIGVLLTHHHMDHVGALSFFEKSIIYDFYNLEEKEYNIGDFKFEVIYTPGHTNDSVSYYFREINGIFSGDFIFYENIGRYDLPTGDFYDMCESIDKIKKYNSDIIIYPGHGANTTLGYEMENNKYFRDL